VAATNTFAAVLSLMQACILNTNIRSGVLYSVFFALGLPLAFISAVLVKCFNVCEIKRAFIYVEL